MKWTLRPLQQQALAELTASPAPRGGVIGISVGGGKTITAMLAPDRMQAQRALLIVPAHLKAQTLRDHATWSARFRCTPPTVVTYAKISRNPRLLRDLHPDLVICDEAHYLSNPDSARTQRVIRYAQDFPDTRWVFMSGSFAKDSIKDYWHLSLMALREGCPLPHDRDGLELWMRVLDVGAKPADSDLRALREFGRTPKQIRQALGARFRAAPGVVWQTEGYGDVPLEISPVTHTLTPKVVAALKILDTLWELPDGTPLVDAADIARHQATLPWGFWQAWDWDAVGGFDGEWNEARLEWSRAVRAIREWGDRELDSLSTIVAAVEAGGLEQARHAYDAWRAVRDRHGKPPSVPVFFDAPAVSPILAEVRRMADGIVWYRNPALGDLLRGHGIPTYGRGDGMPDPAHPVVALSSRVYGTGTDGLQERWFNNLVLQPPANWEQLIGRTHRSGQTETVRVGAVVTTDHQKRSLGFSKVKALFADDLFAQGQKLLTATWRDSPSWG